MSLPTKPSTSILRRCDRRRKTAVARGATPTRRSLVPHLLRQLIPLDAVAHLRSQLPTQALRNVIGVTPQKAGLLDGIVRRRRRDEPSQIARRVLHDPIEVHRHGPPPSPVLADDPADPIEAD